MKDGSKELRDLLAERRPSLAAELWAFVKENRKWWLVPIFLVLLVLGALVLLSGSGAGPFIYTLF